MPVVTLPESVIASLHNTTENSEPVLLSPSSLSNMQYYGSLREQSRLLATRYHSHYQQQQQQQQRQQQNAFGQSRQARGDDHRLNNNDSNNRLQEDISTSTWMIGTSTTDNNYHSGGIGRGVGNSGGIGGGWNRQQYGEDVTNSAPAATAEMEMSCLSSSLTALDILTRMKSNNPLRHLPLDKDRQKQPYAELSSRMRTMGEVVEISHSSLKSGRNNINSLSTDDGCGGCNDFTGQGQDNNWPPPPTAAQSKSPQCRNLEYEEEDKDTEDVGAFDLELDG